MKRVHLLLSQLLTFGNEITKDGLLGGPDNDLTYVKNCVQKDGHYDILYQFHPLDFLYYIYSGFPFLTGQSETACFLGDENDGIPSKQITNGFCDMMQPSNNRNFTDGLAFCMAKKCLL
jgi:hypothetical protein